MSTGKRRAGDEVSGKSEVTKRLKLMQGEQHEHNHEHGQVAGDDLPVMSLEQSKGAVCFDERYDRTSKFFVTATMHCFPVIFIKQQGGN